MSLLRQFLKFEHIIFGFILLIFHSLIWSIDLGTIHFAVSMILLGLFLLWQPIWSKQSSIQWVKILVPSVLFLLLSYTYPYESLFLFGLVAIGIFGSCILDQQTSRPFDLLAISLLTLELGIGVLPYAFPRLELPPLFSSVIENVLFVPIFLFFFSTHQSREHADHSNVDLLHGLLAGTLISLVLLGGVVINVLYGVAYLDGLLLTLFIITVLTFGVSWFWNPSVGFSGLGVLWNRYSMSIGSPFESWINTLTTLIEEEYLTPSEFLQSACDKLTENDWLNGIKWSSKNNVIKSGTLEGFETIRTVPNNTTVNLFFKSDPGEALKQHTDLLLRMAYQFYSAKKNQEKIRTQEHFETIHHTGARLTHDIKNILQSIKTSLSIIQLEPNIEHNKPLKLLDQNLNQISTRLENTLDKLKKPELNTRFKLIKLSKWAQTFEKEYNSDLYTFSQEIRNDIEVPTELLDSVISNLINNARNKKEVRDIKIQVLCDQQLLFISVCDNGHAMPENTAESLFKNPVSGGQGMGIGLYQSAIMAQSFGFELELMINEPERVCFSLVQYLNE